MLVSNSNILKVNGSWLTPKINYNPLNLPPKTIRVQYSEGVTPTVGDSQTLVDAENNIWDITKNSSSWSDLLKNQYDLVSILGANSEGVTNMFSFCEMTVPNSSKLRSVALFDTSSVTNIGLMFGGNKLITEIPLFDFHNVTRAVGTFDACESIQYLPDFNLSSSQNISSICRYCMSLKQIPDFHLTDSLTDCSSAFAYAWDVESGILDMYNKLSGFGTVISHTQTFIMCGTHTTSGSAELAQIPSDWK